MSQDRLKFRVGDVVYSAREEMEVDGRSVPAVMTVRRVEPALDAPYFCSDNEFHPEDDLLIWTPPQRTLQDFQAELKRVAEHVRKRFNDCHFSYVGIDIAITGNTTGDIKIQFEVKKEQYTNEVVRGYDLETAVDELIRRHHWNRRNKPDQLTYAGSDEVDPF